MKLGRYFQSMHYVTIAVLFVVAVFIILGGGLYFMNKKPVVQSHRSYSMNITRETPNKVPGQPVSFTYTIKNDRGEVLKDFETVHEKKMHFIVVREDLQNFQHLHPEFNEGSGEWTVDVTFPTDGPYRVFPDFTPAKSADNLMLLPVTVNSRVEVGDMGKYKAQSLTPDTQPRKTFGDYQVTHTLLSNLTKQQEVNYSLTIERNDQAVTDLQQYLGAMGHSVILKEGTLDFIHTHAGEAGMGGMDHGSTMGNASKTGPNIEFTTTFPESGIYKIFTQFQHQNNIITTDYVVMVN